MFTSTTNPTLDPPIYSQFNGIYNTLSDGAKRALLEDHLLPLIDLLPSPSKRTLLSTAHALQSRYTQLPPLSLPAKKAEINVLLEELRLDSCRSLRNSRHEEIAEETVDSIVDWLSDIWQTVYEVGVDFERGHECLLYCCEVLQQVAIVGSGCKCGFMNLYLSVTIKDRSGEMVKEFSYPGAYLLEDACLWIWRDMLLRMLADGRKSDVEAIPRMLREIQSATREWETVLDRLLVAGGRTFRFKDSGCNVDEDYEDYDHEYLDSLCPHSYSRYCHYCPNSAAHWPPSIHNQLSNLRTCISTTLHDTFTLHPSLSLYITILCLTPTSRDSLLAHLQCAIPYSAPAAAAALDIHAYENDPTALLATLNAARPVLRARDAVVLQRAASFLMHIPTRAYLQTASALVERELRTCLATIRGAVLARAFGGIDNAQGKVLFVQVGRCSVGSTQRQEAVGRWVDAVMTVGQPAVAPGNPLNFATFIMGFLPNFEPEDPGDLDPFLFSEIKEGHPDYEDLLDQWRPRLKDRFEGWVRVAVALKGLVIQGGKGEGEGMELLRRLAAEMVELMPWVGEEDVVREMISRIQDKPTKHHICEALDALLEFMKAHKQRELYEERRWKSAGSAGMKIASDNSKVAVGGSSEMVDSNGVQGSAGGQLYTRPKLSTLDNMESLLSSQAAVSRQGTPSIGSALASASRAGSTTGGRAAKGKGKEREPQPYSFTIPSRDASGKGKGKGKGLSPVVSSMEEETETWPMSNGGGTTPSDAHASGSVCHERVVGGSGNENASGSRSGSGSESAIGHGAWPRTWTHTSNIDETVSHSSPSLSDKSMPELEPCERD